MNKFILLFFSIVLSINSFGQTLVKTGETFTSLQEINGKTILLKEIEINKEKIKQDPFLLVKNLVSANYGNDHFYSITSFDNKNKEAVIKSRIDLVLPPNKKGERQSLVMKYKLNCFIFQDKCVMEIEDITFVHDDFEKNKLYNSRVVDAQQLISNKALKVNDNMKEMRLATKKSALQIFNMIANELEITLGQNPILPNR